jgi:hypothetical protein
MVDHEGEVVCAEGFGNPGEPVHGRGVDWEGVENLWLSDLVKSYCSHRDSR